MAAIIAARPVRRSTFTHAPPTNSTFSLLMIALAARVEFGLPACACGTHCYCCFQACRFRKLPRMLRTSHEVRPIRTTRREVVGNAASAAPPLARHFPFCPVSGGLPVFPVLLFVFLARELSKHSKGILFGAVLVFL